MPNANKGYGNSTTISFDVTDKNTAKMVLLSLAETVAGRLRKDQVKIEVVEVLYSEEKTYAGIETVEHLCRIGFCGRREIVKLIYTKESCRWVIVKG